MRRLALPLMALVLLTINIYACSQENSLGKAVAPLFNDPQKVKQASYDAWRTARDEGLSASMKKSSEHLRKAIASADVNLEKAAADAFAAWWHTIAAQYWSEIEAQKPGGEGYVTAVEGIKKARQNLERALGWDAAMVDRVQREAYHLMQGYK